MKWSYWKRPLYPVTIEVDKIIFPDGSELESSNQLDQLTTVDAHNAILRAFTQLAPAQSEVTTKEGLLASALLNKATSTSFVSGREEANTIAQQALVDATAAIGVDYDIREFVAYEDIMKVDYKVSNEHYDANYDRYELEITARVEPNVFKEPIVFINSPEINFLSSSVTLPALFFESLRAYESIYERRGRREFISKHYFLGEKQNGEFRPNGEFRSSGILLVNGGHF